MVGRPWNIVEKMSSGAVSCTIGKTGSTAYDAGGLRTVVFSKAACILLMNPDRAPDMKPLYLSVIIYLV